MKTLEQLLTDREVVAAVETLAARGCTPTQASELVDRQIAHGRRRSGSFAERYAASVALGALRAERELVSTWRCPTCRYKVETLSESVLEHCGGPMALESTLSRRRVGPECSTELVNGSAGHG